MEDVEELCKRVIVINFGKVIYDGDLDKLIKKHSPFKEITVILDKEIDEEKIKRFGDLHSYNFPEWILRVDKEKTNKIASDILANFPVEDISIEDPDVDTVIHDIFSKSRK